MVTNGGFMKKGSWKDSEVKALFSVVEDVKESNKPLKTAFVLHAEKYSRKPNSVRNYYYQELDSLSEDKIRQEKLGINLAKHQKIEINYFSPEGEERLMQEIKRRVEKEGCSVRKACLSLAGGDIETMLRYQNKYRNFITKQQPDNVIAFRKPKKEGLSDSDINSLFMGLVRLVKRTAVEEYSQKVRQERTNQNYLLQKTLVDLNKKEKEISQLKKQFLALKLENSKLIQGMQELRCDSVRKLPKGGGEII